MSAPGSSNHHARLEESDIPLIRGLIAEGLTPAEIAPKFEVDARTISDVKTGHTWRHV